MTLGSDRSSIACFALIASSAMLYSLAFPPFEWSAFAWVALVPLVQVTRRASLGRAFWLGVLWSLLVGCGTASFMPATLHAYFDLAMPLAVAAAIAATLQTGAFYGVATCAVAILHRRSALGPFAFAAVWTLCEWLRTVVPPANPWALTGYGQMGELAFAQVAEWVGALGVGTGVALANGAIVELLHPARRRDARSFATVGCALGVVLIAVVFGAVRLSESPVTSASAKVALIQGALTDEERAAVDGATRSLQRYRGLSESAMRQEPRLVLWPEYSLPGAVVAGSDADETLAQVVGSLGVPVLVGAATRDGDVLRNSMLLYGSGDAVSRYDKRWLLPFAERPVGFAFAGPETPLASGKRVAPIETPVGPVGVLVCNEIMLPSLAARAVSEGAELLVNPANDGWFGPLGAESQLRLAIARAIETRRFVLRPTRSGVTAVIDPHGRVLERSRWLEPSAIVAAIARRSGTTAYAKFGDLPLVALSLAVLGVVAARVRSESR